MHLVWIQTPYAMRGRPALRCHVGIPSGKAVGAERRPRRAASPARRTLSGAAGTAGKPAELRSPGPHANEPAGPHKAPRPGERPRGPREPCEGSACAPAARSASGTVSGTAGGIASPAPAGATHSPPSHRSPTLFVFHRPVCDKTQTKTTSGSPRVQAGIHSEVSKRHNGSLTTYIPTKLMEGNSKNYFEKTQNVSPLQIGKSHHKMWWSTC